MTRPRTGISRLLAAAAAASALVGLQLLVASPAAAHTRLVATEPAADATVADELDAVALVFSEAIDQSFAEVSVLAPDGAAVAEGAARIDGARVEQPLGALPAVGEYAVAWRIVASDGHPLTGEFTFVYDGPVPADEPEPAGEPTPEATPAPRHGDDADAHARAEPTPTVPDSPTPEPRADEHDEDDAGAAAAPAGADGPPAGLLSVTAAVLLALLGTAAFALRALARWQPTPS